MAFCVSTMCMLQDVQGFFLLYLGVDAFMYTWEVAQSRGASSGMKQESNLQGPRRHDTAHG